MPLTQILPTSLLRKARDIRLKVAIYVVEHPWHQNLISILKFLNKGSDTFLMLHIGPN